MTVALPNMQVINALGWRQGSFLSDDHVAQIQDASYLQLESHLSGPIKIVVIGQDCDVVHLSLDLEPTCEVIVFRQLEEIEPNKMWGKSGREIHFRFADGKEYGCSIHDKYRFPRQFLIDAAPDQGIRLADTDLTNLKIWLGKRYSRQSFPDAFNTRYERARSKVVDELKKTGDLFESIYLQGNFIELDEDQEYEIQIVGAMYDDDYDQEDLRDRAETSLTKVAGLVERRCDGITVNNYVVRARRDISLSEQDVMYRWDYLDPISSAR